MNSKEWLFVAVGVFLTFVAWTLIEIYHISANKYINREIPPVSIPAFKVNTNIFPTLADKKP